MFQPSVWKLSEMKKKVSENKLSEIKHLKLLQPKFFAVMYPTWKGQQSNQVAYQAGAISCEATIKEYFWSTTPLDRNAGPWKV